MIAKKKKQYCEKESNLVAKKVSDLTGKEYGICVRKSARFESEVIEIYLEIVFVNFSNNPKTTLYFGFWGYILAIFAMYNLVFSISGPPLISLILRNNP